MYFFSAKPNKPPSNLTERRFLINNFQTNKNPTCLSDNF
ncbi:MAG: hypothetical protein AVDCRST_MAG74-2819 [uncultured Pyrinomonadaceae bacterium]|uniref:Uncharacterized protein n=1 Tax=uncultured Pyrinomonadaceae bacterium TaxID=2283094 RepID=A0A6J4PKT5_9BACT|nr:MAG: hypothetical protein AVDCRST_MAG74-2819 [uncultured Pyrinomonadaceae bacterium]